MRIEGLIACIVVGSMMPCGHFQSVFPIKGYKVKKICFHQCSLFQKFLILKNILIEKY